MDRIQPPNHQLCPALAGTASPLDWDQLFRQHGRWLRMVIRARCAAPDEVDELFQDVALAAVAGEGSLRCLDSVGPWLYRIAIHRCLLYRRRAGRQRRRWSEIVRRSGEAATSRGGELAGDPLCWILAEERDQLVRSALHHLPDRDKEVLMLKYGQGWSCRDVAKHLGIGSAAVEARLHRARQRLRTLLVDGECDGDSRRRVSP